MNRGARAPRDATRALGLALCARPHLALLGLLGLLYLPWIAAIPLDGTLEGNRLEAAREMLRSGDWIVPRLGGEVYLAKPPLHPWTIALVSWPLGDVSIASGRVVSAVAALAACSLVLRWGRREFGRRTGMFAALALGGSVLLLEKGVRAELESVLTLCTTIALLALWQASSYSNGSSRGARLVSGLALGAAVLVKGPPALIVFLATGTALGLRAGSLRRAALASSGTAIAVALACVLAWLLPLYARLGMGSPWSAFRAQFLERIVSAGRTNAEPIWFYGPALLVGLLPAALYVPGLALVRPGRPGEGATARRRSTFLWAWALLPLLLFSLSSGKETRYLLPTLPAWALLLAWGWTRARTTQRFLGWRRALVRALSIVTWCAPFAWLVSGWILFPQAAPVVMTSALLALLARALFARSVRNDRPRLLLGALALALATTKLAWAGTFLTEQQRRIPVADVAREVRARVAPGETWILVGPYRSWWHFSVNRPCLAVADWSALRAATREGPRPRFALAPESALPPSAQGFEQVRCWNVDGESTCLVRLEP